MSNLSEKLKKEELRKLLYALFSSHGPLLEVIALKTNKLRGQAFVIFKDIQAATKARRELNGFPFYGRPLRVTFARERSHLVEKQDGTFSEEKAEALRKAREANAPQSKRKAASAAAATAAAGGVGGAASGGAVPAEEDATKRHKVDFQAPDESPNPILFVQNLPAESTELMVQMLFQQFPGYKSVRLIEGQGIAFVEFGDATSSTVAKNALQNFKIKDNHLMMISFLKS